MAVIVRSTVRRTESICRQMFTEIGDLISFGIYQISLDRQQMTFYFDQLTIERYNTSGDSFNSLQ